MKRLHHDKHEHKQNVCKTKYARKNQIDAANNKKQNINSLSNVICVHGCWTQISVNILGCELGCRLSFVARLAIWKIYRRMHVSMYNLFGQTIRMRPSFVYQICAEIFLLTYWLIIMVVVDKWHLDIHKHMSVEERFWKSIQNTLPWNW